MNKKLYEWMNRRIKLTIYLFENGIVDVSNNFDLVLSTETSLAN
jgi:hypothetical protein